MEVKYEARFHNNNNNFREKLKVEEILGLMGILTASF